MIRCRYHRAAPNNFRPETDFPLRTLRYISCVLLLLALGPAMMVYAQATLSISDIRITPASPTHLQVITISAAVTSDSTITAVTLVDLQINNTLQNNRDMEQAANGRFEVFLDGQNASTTVSFRIRAQDNAGNTENSPIQSFQVTLVAPTLNAFFNDAETLVTLAWNSVPGATSYDVFRSLEPGADILIATGLSSPGYIDDRIGNARQLFYKVAAVRNNVSVFSNEESLTQAFNSSPFSLVGGQLDTLLVAPSAADLTFPELVQNLNELFVDVDGDALVYSIPDPGMLFNPRIMDDSVLVVSFPPVLGQISFRVGADDLRGGKAFIDFIVTLDAPPSFILDGDEPEVDQPPTRDNAVTISVQVDDNNLDRVSINFRRGGDDSFFNDVMIETEPGRFEYTIPAFAVGDRGLEYTLDASDQNGLVSIAPDVTSATRIAYSLEVLIPDEGIRKLTPQPAAATTPNAYRLFSIPILAEAESPEAVLEDDLRSYKPTRWRFFEPDPATPSSLFPEFPNTSPLSPGKAFWLIVRDENQLIDTGAGRTLPTDEVFEITLAPGWNFIGNPFNFDIPANQLITEDGTTPDIRFFDGSGWFIIANETALVPFEGYAVSNNTANPTTLRLFPSSELLALRQGTSTSKQAAATKPDWVLDIIASVNTARKTGSMQDTSRIVLQQDSQPGWDPNDLPAPPAFGDHVSVAFVHEDWERPLKRYAVDARPLHEDGDVWTFEVASTQPAPITLTFAGLDAIPEGLEAYLVDPQRNTSQDLAQNPVYTVSNQRQQLRVVIGPAAFTDAQLETLELPDATYQLAPAFPNPFAQTTTIPFHLPEAATVTLGIYNVLGENVNTLALSRPLPAGPQAIIWDGTNQEGSPVANGLYFVRLSTANYVATDTVVLVR